jgi:peptide/nickel transport system permease protein
VSAAASWREAAHRFGRDRWAAVALVFLVAIHLAAALAPWLVERTLHQSAYRQRMMDVVEVEGRPREVVNDVGIPLGPNARFPLGADLAGRDVLSRILIGARVSLLVATFGTLLGLAIGVAAGLVAGFYRGVVDVAISRFLDAVMSIPVLLLAIALAAVLPAGGVWTLVLVLGLVNWTTVARVVRAETLSLRSREFIEAARALGAPTWRILARHLLPNLIGTILVFATLSMAGNILLESALSFLGVGIQPPTPSWGNMIQEGVAYYGSAWWIAGFPGLAILMTVVSYNLVGDGLRTVFDPSSAPEGEG